MSTVDLTNSEEILTSEGAAKFLGIEPVTFKKKAKKGRPRKAV